MHAPNRPTPPSAASRPAIDLRCRRLAPRHVHDLVAFLGRLAGRRKVKLVGMIEQAIGHRHRDTNS
jgi:hypothetical protein